MRRPPSRNKVLPLSLVYDGRRDNPIVIPPCSDENAILTVLKTLQSWEHSHTLSFDILTWDEAGDIGPGIHQVLFRRRIFTETQIHTDKIAFYFDFSAIEGASPPRHSPVLWSYGHAIAFHQDLRWLHFDNHLQNSRDGEPLDVSLFYSCPEGKAAIYVYGSCPPDGLQAITREAEKAFSVAQTMNPEAKAPWPSDHVGPLYGRFLLIGDQISFIGVGAKEGKFIKVHLTFNDGTSQHREMMRDCMEAITQAIDGRALSWKPQEAIRATTHDGAEMTKHSELSAIIKRHADVFSEIKALDVTFRMDLDSDARLEIAPWIMLGREEMASEELAIWRLLDSKEIDKREAIVRMSALMEAYYGLFGIPGTRF